MADSPASLLEMADGGSPFPRTALFLSPAFSDAVLEATENLRHSHMHTSFSFSAQSTRDAPPTPSMNSKSERLGHCSSADSSPQRGRPSARKKLTRSVSLDLEDDTTFGSGAEGLVLDVSPAEREGEEAGAGRIFGERGHEKEYGGVLVTGRRGQSPRENIFWAKYWPLGGKGSSKKSQEVVGEKPQGSKDVNGSSWLRLGMRRSSKRGDGLSVDGGLQGQYKLHKTPRGHSGVMGSHGSAVTTVSMVSNVGSLKLLPANKDIAVRPQSRPVSAPCSRQASPPRYHQRRSQEQCRNRASQPTLPESPTLSKHFQFLQEPLPSMQETVSLELQECEGNMVSEEKYAVGRLENQAGDVMDASGGIQEVPELPQDNLTSESDQDSPGFLQERYGLRLDQEDSPGKIEQLNSQKVQAETCTKLSSQQSKNAKNHFIEVETVEALEDEASESSEEEEWVQEAPLVSRPVQGTPVLSGNVQPGLELTAEEAKESASGGLVFGIPVLNQQVTGEPEQARPMLLQHGALVALESQGKRLAAVKVEGRWVLGCPAGPSWEATEETQLGRWPADCLFILLCAGDGKVGFRSVAAEGRTLRPTATEPPAFSSWVFQEAEMFLALPATPGSPGGWLPEEEALLEGPTLLVSSLHPHHRLRVHVWAMVTKSLAAWRQLEGRAVATPILCHQVQQLREKLQILEEEQKNGRLAHQEAAVIEMEAQVAHLKGQVEAHAASSNSLEDKNGTHLPLQWRHQREEREKREEGEEREEKGEGEERERKATGLEHRLTTVMDEAKELGKKLQLLEATNAQKRLESRMPPPGGEENANDPVIHFMTQTEEEFFNESHNELLASKLEAVLLRDSPESVREKMKIPGGRTSKAQLLKSVACHLQGSLNPEFASKSEAIHGLEDHVEEKNGLQNERKEKSYPWRVVASHSTAREGEPKSEEPSFHVKDSQTLRVKHPIENSIRKSIRNPSENPIEKLDENSMENSVVPSGNARGGGRSVSGITAGLTVRTGKVNLMGNRHENATMGSHRTLKDHHPVASELAVNIVEANGAREETNGLRGISSLRRPGWTAESRGVRVRASRQDEGNGVGGQGQPWTGLEGKPSSRLPGIGGKQSFPQERNESTVSQITKRSPIKTLAETSQPGSMLQTVSKGAPGVRSVRVAATSSLPYEEGRGRTDKIPLTDKIPQRKEQEGGERNSIPKRSASPSIATAVPSTKKKAVESVQPSIKGNVSPKTKSHGNNGGVLGGETAGEQSANHIQGPSTVSTVANHGESGRETSKTPPRLASRSTDPSMSLKSRVTALKERVNALKGATTMASETVRASVAPKRRPLAPMLSTMERKEESSTVNRVDLATRGNEESVLEKKVQDPKAHTILSSREGLGGTRGKTGLGSREPSPPNAIIRSYRQTRESSGFQQPARSPKAGPDRRTITGGGEGGGGEAMADGDGTRGRGRAATFGFEGVRQATQRSLTPPHRRIWETSEPGNVPSRPSNPQLPSSIPIETSTQMKNLKVGSAASLNSSGAVRRVGPSVRDSSTNIGNIMKGPNNVGKENNVKKTSITMTAHAKGSYLNNAGEGRETAQDEAVPQGNLRLLQSRRITASRPLTGGLRQPWQEIK